MKTEHPKYIFFLALSILYWSCVHEPINGPVDPGGGGGVDPIDTTDTGIPCDPDVVYFERDVLPILKSNCAFSGCHNAGTAQDDIILESYESVMASDVVRANRLDNSDLYEAITDDDIEDRMPPQPRNKLSNEQIELIGKWILQGARNEMCDSNAGACDTTNVSYSQDLKPIFNNSCVGCHNSGNASGGIRLDDYAGIRTVADNGRLVGAITWAPSFQNMPQGGQKLDDCKISLIQAWINQGSGNN